MPMLIGDVHGKIGEYINLIKDEESSIQLGDMGFRVHYNVMTRLFEENNIDSTKHVFIMGNHDDRDHIPENALSTFGMKNIGGLDFFYASGAYSVDRQYRTWGTTWWPNEELEYEQVEKLLEEYAANKPDVVLSHDCPRAILPSFATNTFKNMNPSFTNVFMQDMLRIHKPKKWIFGHHHVSATLVWRDTTEFTCLAELDWMRI